MIYGEYKLRGSSLCIFLHPFASVFILGPNILLVTLFSTVLSLCETSGVGLGRFECWQFSNVSANIVVAMFRLATY
jgi:hypothetical protein